MIVIFLHACHLPPCYVAASLLPVGFGVYQIRLGATGLLGN
jgi:hypothetical protein